MASIQKRRTAGGKVSYRVQVRLRGHPAQTATFARKTDAKRWAQQTESAIREGRHFKTTEAKRHTVADLIDRYIHEVVPTKRSGPRQHQQLRWWRDAVGDYTLADLTPALIAEHRDRLGAEPTRRSGGRSAATVRRYLAALSHALTVASREWGWIDDSPMRRVTKPTEPRGRVRYLSDDERRRLLEACCESPEPTLHTIVVLALATGMRQGEIVGLPWRNVDLERGRVVLDDTKNGELRALPITGLALDVLAEHASVRRIDSPLVFPSRDGTRPRFPRYAWERALLAADINDFRFHDLRHSAASYLAMEGASLMEIADVLGHKTLKMVKRYAHLSEGHTRTIVASMNARIFGSAK